MKTLNKNIMKNTITLIILLTALIFSSCSKNDAEEYEATKMKLIEKLDKLDVPAAMKSSDNDYAVTATGYVDEVKGIADYFSYIEVPEGSKHSKVNGNDEFEWDYAGYAIYETFYETSSSYVWEIDIDVDGNRLEYIVSKEDKDGMGGSMEILNAFGTEDTDLSIFTYNWEFDESDNAKLTWASSDGSFKHEITSNTDYSGSAIMYVNGEIFQEFIWNSDGGGSTAYYMGGVPMMEDTWTADDL